MPSSTLAWRAVADDEFLLAMPAGHPMAGSSPLPASALAGLPMLLLEDGHCLRDQALEVCASVDEDGADGGGGIQATSLTTLCQMVAAGQGVTLLPASAVEVEARAGTDVVVRPVRDPIPHRRIVMAWRATAPVADLLDAFADAVSRSVQACCDAGLAPR